MVFMNQKYLAFVFDNHPQRSSSVGRGESSEGSARGRGNGFGGRGNGFRGRGRGWVPGEPNGYEQEDLELGIPNRVDPSARNRLVSGDGTVGGTSPGHVTDKVLRIEGAASEVANKSLPSIPQKYQDLKRQRKEGDSDFDMGTNDISATSFEEDRREQ